MIYGFAKLCGGQVTISSEEGRGTTVSIYLPRHVMGGDVNDEQADQRVLRRSEQGETILVVDDEPTVRKLISDLLHELD